MGSKPNPDSLKNSRRFWLSLAAIVALFILGHSRDADVTWAIASIALGTSAANAYQKKPRK